MSHETPCKKWVLILVTFWVGLWMGLIFSPSSAIGQHREEGLHQHDLHGRYSLRQLIERIQQDLGYHVLYRESLISGIQVDLKTSPENLFEDLKAQLEQHLISVRVDHSRRQVVLLQIAPPTSGIRNISITGFVVDDQTGERLPFATISWYEHGNFRGTLSSASGTFAINRWLDEPEITITATYVGYQRTAITLNLTEERTFSDITMRLRPSVIRGRDVVISEYLGYNSADTLMSNIIDASRFTPLGESSTIRALQSHPSVSIGSAYIDGLHVRGSAPDGFMVLLDGVTLFNQSHLYGLLDSFNKDAVQSAGFYLDIIPAHIDAPTGGTLNLITRTGSRSDTRFQTGLGNTSINATAEGPLSGKSSWLLSGRTTYMDHLNWFNNSDLVRWGLDVGRPRGRTDRERDFLSDVLVPGESSAKFVDIHAKISIELRQASRLILSGYFGGDRTEHTAQRRTRTTVTQEGYDFRDVLTSNEWGNVLGSVRYETRIGSQLFGTTTAGISSYATDFAKDDFIYIQMEDAGDANNVFIYSYPFRNRSSLNEYRLNQEFELTQGNLHMIGGLGFKHYEGVYAERSFDRASYRTEDNMGLVESYLQTRIDLTRSLNLMAGIRSHLYTSTSNWFWSPRIASSIYMGNGFTVHAGYAKNHQFMHKIALENAASSDVWIITDRNSTPGNSDQFSVGFDWKSMNGAYLKMDLFQRTFRNMRIHELNAGTLEGVLSENPWFHKNRGEAGGFEFLYRYRFDRIVLSQTYTWLEVFIRNESLEEPVRYPAPWNREHVSNTIFEIELTNEAQLFVSWLMMSGRPDPFDETGVARIDPYFRLDTSVQWTRQFNSGSTLTATFSLFNVLNRENTWYRTYDYTFERSLTVPRLQAASVDVYDLGIQPSFSVSYRF